MDIEDALRWVYCDELPKMQDEASGRIVSSGASLQPMWRGGVFGSRIDNWHREPGFPSAMGDPDPDAHTIALAIQALDVDQLDLSDTLITYQLPGNYDSHALLEKARGEVRGLLMTMARQRRRPSLDETVSVEPVRSITGQISVFRMELMRDEDIHGNPIEFMHEAPTKAVRGGQYKRGTYSKLRYRPTAAERALDRARYAVWWIGQAHIARHLSGTVMERNGEGRLAPRPILARLGLRAPAAPRYPWLGDALPHSPQVLTSGMSPTRPDVVLERAIELGHRRPTARRQKGRPVQPVRQIPVSEYRSGDEVA